MNSSVLIHKEVTKWASRKLSGGGNKEMIYPYEELRKDLTAMVDGPIFSTKSAVMKITMPFEGLFIWRRAGE